MRKNTSIASVRPKIPKVGEAKRGESGYLSYLLRQAHIANRTRISKTLDDFGVTAPQYSVMTMLGAYPGASGADIARLSLLTPQTVGAIIANLEAAGLVARHAHATHGRIQQRELTDKGRALLEDCKARVAFVEKALAAGLSLEEERAIRAWLVRVAIAAGATPEDI